MNYEIIVINRMNFSMVDDRLLFDEFNSNYCPEKKLAMLGKPFLITIISFFCIEKSRPKEAEYIAMTQTVLYVDNEAQRRSVRTRSHRLVTRAAPVLHLCFFKMDLSNLTPTVTASSYVPSSRKSFARYQSREIIYSCCCCCSSCSSFSFLFAL